MTALAVLATVAEVQAKAVFAHYMVGITSGYQPSDWSDDISKAKAAGIDGFALNIGPIDDYNDRSLQNAADAANQAGGFSLFLSFDYASNPDSNWTPSTVIDRINSFVTTAGNAHYRYNSQPLVSTFEGPSHSSEWAGIKSATNCFFIPDWSSLGPAQIPIDAIDGAFSWDAWPHGPTSKDNASDLAWEQSLGAKPYMMGVSPWFYTDLPGKNWGLRGDGLWSTRWDQAAEIQPEFVQIISWNDFGESHYIGPIRPAGIVPGANRYVDNNPHDAWRDVLPYYIAQYKNGAPPPVNEDKVVFYHKPNPSASCSDDGTLGDQPNSGDASYTIGQVSLDQISIIVLSTDAADVSVQIGSNTPTALRAENAGAHQFAVDFAGQTGSVTVTVTRNGQSVAAATGPGISTDCPGGLTNFNAVVYGS